MLLSSRHLQPELMDQPDLDVRDHHRALVALGRANLVSRTTAALWPAVRRAARTVRDRRVRVLDVACGGGDTVVGLAARARHEGLALDFTGADISPVAIAFARTRAARAGVGDARFIRLNALHDELPAGTDVVISTLFLHHLDDDAGVCVLRRMKEAAGCSVIVSDLRRTALGCCYTWAGCRMLSRSRVFHVDGLRSVRAAFTTDEARDLAVRAGLDDARLVEHWPQRWMLTWERQRP
jgi:2-polyprenyl-3-methyl-5-hydroxy-6-metoxy-1,4-benzoquinol methylase